MKPSEIQEACAQACDGLVIEHPGNAAQTADQCAAAIRALKFEEDMQPCRSPYCECEQGQCTHPGFYDARGEVSAEPVAHFQVTGEHQGYKHYDHAKPCPRCAELQQELQTTADALGQANHDLMVRETAAVERLKNALRRVDESFNDERINLTHTAEELVAEMKATIAQQAKSIAYWKADSAAAWDKCEERRKENEQQAERIKELETILKGIPLWTI